ncbi:Uu.00g103290.m01.CDS01 [Anthostomella pinea]|uniref:Uu.00g103290.m01.CDS01 n=1 Tax=Anthostomella pinea TaxID=933095 RepID=A0AAI8YD66_9PEZI|nr:Uu.00g103290.m01.CDS01 [Anthostomella pinea]
MSNESYDLNELFRDVGSSPERRSTERGRNSSPLRSIEIDPIGPTPRLPPPIHSTASDEDGPRDLSASPAQREGSLASSAPMPAIIIPRNKRRGLLAWMAVLPEVDRPYDYGNSTKWTITILAALAGCAAPMGSAILYPALPEMAKDLNVAPTLVNFAVAFYMLAMSIFPLWWSSFSERFGRRSVYLTSFLLNIAFSIGSGFSRNIAMLIVFRVLSGGAAASAQAVGAGTIADIWESRERGSAMGIFYLGPLMGPLLAPIIGGGLTASAGWRSTMWFLAAYGAFVWVAVLIGVPETLAREKQQQIAAAVTLPDPSPPPDGNENGLSQTPSRRSVRLKTRKTGAWLKRLLIDPLTILTYIRFPAIALTVSYAAVTFGSLYVLNISIQSVFSAPPYGFSPIVVGLLYVPASSGYFIASLLGGPWLDRIMMREARKAGRYDARGKLIVLPEFRMAENAWLSASLYPGALIWYGWSVQYGVHWIVPAVANFFFGLGSMLVFSMATTMLTEFMPRSSSSGVALNNFVRNILSCIGGIAGQPLIDAIGNGWLATGVAIIAWVMGNYCIFTVRRNAERWRIQMDDAMSRQR